MRQAGKQHCMVGYTWGIASLWHAHAFDLKTVSGVISSCYVSTLIISISISTYCYEPVLNFTDKEHVGYQIELGLAVLSTCDYEICLADA
jgi:hypothetical protein